MRIRLTVPGKAVDEDTLGAALEASTRIAEKEVASGEVPSIFDAIDDGLVRWRPEPLNQGFEGFDLPSTCLGRGWGDCDDLASWLAAELRQSEEDPLAEAIVYQSAPNRWHAVVQRGDGSIDDPSRWAGMGKPGGPLPVTDPVEQGITTIGFARTLGGSRCRIDVPLVGVGWEDYGHEFSGDTGLCIERTGRNTWEALGRCAGDAFHALLTWGAKDDVLARLFAIRALLRGDDPEWIEGICGCSIDDLGELVGAIGHRVGAYKLTPDTGTIADIAATVFDPLGIRNIAAPLAQEFISSYAQGLAQRGSKSSDASKQSTVGATSRGRSSSSARGSSSSRAPQGRTTTTSRQQGSPQQQQSPYAAAQQPYYSPYFTPDDSDWEQWQGYAPQYPYAPPMQPLAPSTWGGPAFNPAFGAGYWDPRNPYGADLPGTDIAPDAYGGYATPTAFSQYAGAWAAEQPHSAFDGQIMLGDEDPCPPDWHWENRGGVSVCVP